MLVDAERWVVVVGCGLLYEEQRGADGVVSSVPLLRTAHDERVEYRLQEIVGVFAGDVLRVEHFLDALYRARRLVARLVVDYAYAALAGLLVGDGIESVDDATDGEAVVFVWCT